MDLISRKKKICLFKKPQFTFTQKYKKYYKVRKLRDFASTAHLKNFRDSIIQLQCTVWKSTLKCYHAKKISVKPHNKNMLNTLLQMHDFLLLGSIFGSNRLNEFWRLVHMLELLVKNIFLNQ